MFEALAAAIDEVDIPLDRGCLTEVLALRDRLDARIARAVGDYDHAGLWDIDGDTSMTAWLSHHARSDRQTAGRTARRGAKLRHLPVTAAAFADGTLSAGQIDLLLANIPARHLGRFAAHEATLIPLLADCSIDATRVAVLRWRAMADALDPGPEPTEAANELHLARTLEDRAEVRASLDADHHATLDAALRVADSGDRELTVAQRRAEALDTICRYFLDHQDVAPARRHRPHITVAFDYDAWARGEISAARYVDTDTPVSPRELGVLCCDATFHRLLHDPAGAVLDLGRAARDWSADQYLTIAARDGGCRFPGCDRPPAWCDIHHAHHWEHGGPTCVENGILLCRRHHRILHRPGWSAKLLPDATLEVTAPDGHHQLSHPRLRRRTPAGG